MLQLLYDNYVKGCLVITIVFTARSIHTKGFSLFHIFQHLERSILFLHIRNIRIFVMRQQESTVILKNMQSIYELAVL